MNIISSSIKYFIEFPYFVLIMSIWAESIYLFVNNSFKFNVLSVRIMIIYLLSANSASREHSFTITGHSA